MKRVLCAAAFLVLAAQPPLWGYDTSPSAVQIVPEAIWAAASGGGTWVTELQILSLASTPADVLVYLAYNGGTTDPFVVSSGLAQFHSVRFSNILSTLDALDPGSFIYYGRVGALWVWTMNPDCRIQVQAKTVNGNYGKTFPGLNIVEGNTAVAGRRMVLLDLVKNATYRTFVGVHNSAGSAVIRFKIFDADNVQIGAFIEKTLPADGFMSFNPFTEAGVTSGDYENCWLTIDVVSGPSTPEGVMCFGSIANNFTNDTYALLAKQFGIDSSALPAPPLMRR